MFWFIPPSAARRRLPAMALGLCLAGAMAAADPVPERILQSVRGDAISMVDGGVYPCATTICPARICLTSHHSVALSSGARDVPLQRVSPGGLGCIDLAPVPQTLTFWAEGPDGRMAAVLSAPIDLRGRAGLVTFANWLEQSTP